MSVVYSCPEVSQSIHHETISQPTGFFSAKLLAHLREGKTETTCCSDAAENVEQDIESLSQRVSLAGRALWSLTLWCTPACGHRTVCEKVSFQDSPRGMEGQVFLLLDPQFF